MTTFMLLVAIIGIGKSGRIALKFTRVSTSADEAISSALSNIKNAIPNATLVEATPDLVRITDIAELLGFSRQNMRKLVDKSGAEFPLPMHEGQASIWHLSPVLSWLSHKNSSKYTFHETLLDIATVNMQINLEKEISNYRH